MRHGISKNSVKGRNLQAAYVDGFTLRDFFAFNQGLKKIFISLDTEKTGVPDADTKISMAGDTATLMSDTSLDIKMYGMHQFKMKKGGLRIKLGVFSPEATPS